MSGKTTRAETDLAWGRNAVAFLRERELASEFNDWCGGWPCPVEALGPELLAALEGLVQSLSVNDEDGLTEFAEPMIMARKAIARARGEA